MRSGFRHGRLGVLAAALTLPVGCSLLTSLDGYAGGGSGDGGTTGTEASVPPGPTDGQSPPPDVVAPDGGAKYVAEVLADRPIAYYPLEEPGGETAKDVIGGKNGTFVGKVERGVTGAIGSGAAWDGASTRLEMPVGAFAFADHASYSVEVWINATEVSATVRRVCNFAPPSGHSGYGIEFLTNSPTDGFFYQWRGDGDGGADGYAQANDLLPANKLTHLVATYDGTHTRFFVDGTPGPIANGILAQPAGSDARLVFGDLVDGVYFKFHGMMDEIALYDHALDPTRVKAHFAAR